MPHKKVLVFLILIFCLNFPTIVLADDTSETGKSITLTINWMDDQPEDRPELLTIELIRTLDGTVYPMDSKPLTVKDAVSDNTWKATFTFYYGEVWEYSFKVTKVEPETALYAYQLIETGNGTDAYTFDYIYGQGDTEMTIITHWEGVDEKTRPASLTVDLYSFKDQDHSERSLLLTGEGDSWSASVAGLKDNPDNYFVVLSDLPGAYTNVVSKGDSPNIYINTITPNTSMNNSEKEENVSGHVSNMIHSVTSDKIEAYHTARDVILDIAFVCLIAAAVIFAVRKLKNRKKSKNENRNH